MSKAHAIAHDLPYLRRYARALTGSQTSGDAYVAATLEALSPATIGPGVGQTRQRWPTPTLRVAARSTPQAAR
jgi:hypothetical protein